MSGGQDPSTWDYEVMTDQPTRLEVMVAEYLKAFDANRVADTYRLRAELRKYVTTTGTLSVCKESTLERFPLR